jgi:hypothetical protein
VDKDRYDEFRGKLRGELMTEIGFGTPEWLENDDPADMSSPLKNLTEDQFRNAVSRMLWHGFTEVEIEEGFELMKMGLPASGTSDWSTDRLEDL